MVSQFADFPLRETLLFVEKSNSFGFFKGIHLETNKVLGESWQLVDVVCLNDPSGNGDVFEELAGGHSAPSSDEAVAASFAWCHYDCLQKAVSTDGFCQRLNRFIGDGLSERGPVHVYLVDPNILFHKAPRGGALTITKFVRLGKRQVSGFSPHSPLSEEIKT